MNHFEYKKFPNLIFHKKSQEFHVDFEWHRLRFTSLSGIVLRLSWIICSFLLVVAYNGNLRAALILTSYEDKVDSVDEMVKR